MEAALAEARKAIFVAGHDVEWGTPVLYSRASDGHLFTVTAPAELVEAERTNSENLPGRGDSQLRNAENTPAPSSKLDDLPTDLDDLVLIHAKELLGYDFHIGKYPVTNHQFRRFIEMGGYTDDRWWRDEEGRGRRDQDKWQQPRYWSDTKFNQLIQPVVGISWYEANAYCVWLTAQWQASGKIDSNQQVRLPTQDEWIAAAYGGRHIPQSEVTDYPWYALFDPMYANTKESAIGCTTPVNQYPRGSTVDDVWDMSGNVWEWTAEVTEGTIGYLKGGSWWIDKSQALVCAVGKVSRWLRHNYYGLRVVTVYYQLGNLNAKNHADENMADQQVDENLESDILVSEVKVRQPQYQRRDTVSHPKFGVGTVIMSELIRDDEEVTIAFPGIGIRKLAVSMAKLEKHSQSVSSKNRQLQYQRRDSVQHTRFGVGTVVESQLIRDDEEITVAFPGIGIKKLLASMNNLKKL